MLDEKTNPFCFRGPAWQSSRGQTPFGIRHALVFFPDARVPRNRYCEMIHHKIGEKSACCGSIFFLLTGNSLQNTGKTEIPKSFPQRPTVFTIADELNLHFCDFKFAKFNCNDPSQSHPFKSHSKNKRFGIESFRNGFVQIIAFFHFFVNSGHFYLTSSHNNNVILPKMVVPKPVLLLGACCHRSYRATCKT